MNTIHFLVVAALLACATGCRTTGVRPGATVDAVSRGAQPAGQALSISAGNSAVRVVVGEARDSVHWLLHTTPSGCATVREAAEKISIAERRRNCSANWEVSVPSIEHVDIRASVGDIQLVIHDRRAVQLSTSVGRVAMEIDGNAINAPAPAGSGDRLMFGDTSAGPRVTAKTGVGAISAQIQTVKAGAR